MPRGFYEQLGVEIDASYDRLREGYAVMAERIARRRRVVLDEGGDPAPLDLERSKLDSAWGVLSNPSRRRRYDAMLALSADDWSTDPEVVWRRACGSLVHPAAAAAAELLRVATNLKVGALPPAPRPGGTGPSAPVTRLAPEPGPPAEEPTVTGLTAAPIEPTAEITGVVVEITERVQNTEPDGNRPALRVVDGSPMAAPVVMMPQVRGKALSTEDVARLIDAHGYSGALLKTVRERRGMTLDGVAETTRISVSHLASIEKDDGGALPSSTFVRGYVREVAKLLGLDPDAVVLGYMAHLGK